MPDFPVSPQTAKILYLKMERLGILESDLEEKFIRSSGAGGQNVNKVSTCVVLTHVPSKITIRCQQERTQGMNRFFARRLLIEKLEEQVEGEKSARQQKIEKIRRQKRRRSRRAKEKILHDKKERSGVKELRKNVGF